MSAGVRPSGHVSVGQWPRHASRDVAARRLTARTRRLVSYDRRLMARLTIIIITTFYARTSRDGLERIDNFPAQLAVHEVLQRFWLLTASLHRELKRQHRPGNIL